MKILYIGNSYTFFNDLPGLVAAFMEAAGMQPGYARYLRGGASFQTHWMDNFGEKRQAQPCLAELDPERIGGMDELLGFYEYDAVVLQSHSRDTLDRPEAFMAFGQKVAQRVRQAGKQRIVLYETWARQATPDDQGRIVEMYGKLAAEIDAEVAPVGRAWREAFKRIDGLTLHVEDGSHPNPAGTYLAGCVFYNVLTGKSPVGLPHELPHLRHNETTGIHVYSPADAKNYQQIAADAVAAAE